MTTLDDYDGAGDSAWRYFVAEIVVRNALKSIKTLNFGFDESLDKRILNIKEELASLTEYTMSKQSKHNREAKSLRKKLDQK